MNSKLYYIVVYQQLQTYLLMTKIIFGYWKLRGLGQHLRLLLAYSGLDFQQVQYESQEQWFKQDRLNLGFEFPNLPYLIDGQFKLTESTAIAKYIANRSGKTHLLGKDVHDQGKVENLIGVLNDALKDIRGLFMNKDHDKLKLEQLQKVRSKFEYLKHFVGEKPFALGYVTIVDFIFAENLYYFQTLFPNEKKHYDFWWRIRHNLESLPEVKAYYDRPDAVQYPFLPPFALLSPSLPKVKLCYWKIRGLAQNARLLLAYFGVEFEDYHYTSSDKWFLEDKLHLGLDFPNLPYLIDGEFNITESGAIYRYIIKKWGKVQLLGKNPQDRALVESFLSVFIEVSSTIKGLFFDKDYDSAKGAIIEKYKFKLQQLNKFVGEKDFVLGYLTLADFIVAEDSHYIERIYPEEYKILPFLRKIRENFNKVPEIVAYYEKPTAFKGRFFPESAQLSVETD